VLASAIMRPTKMPMTTNTMMSACLCKVICTPDPPVVILVGSRHLATRPRGRPRLPRTGPNSAATLTCLGSRY
jgi:hypothetical protein